MATSLIGGLIANGYSRSHISATDPDSNQLSRLTEDFGIATTGDNALACARADIVVLAVKPQVMETVCSELARAKINSGCLFISIAAGVRVQDIDRWLGGNRAVIRVMPNTPALVQLGASALYANTRVNTGQKDLAQAILDAVGISVWVEQESNLDAVTAISGSGPAYFFYFIELLQQAGERLGLSAETAEILAKQTALGAATMAQGKDVVRLRAQVTSKKGTTEQAIRSFEENGLAALVEKATLAAHDRSVELAQQLANQ